MNPEREPITRESWSSNAEYVKSCSAGEILFLEGDRCEAIGFLLAGKITICSSNPMGEEFLIQLVTPGQFFGDVMTFANASVYLGNVVAAETSQIAFFSPAHFLRILKNTAGLLEDYLEQLSLKTFSLKQDVKLLAVPALRDRILFFLRAEAKRQGSLRMDIGMSREEFAAKLGVCRPSLSRELSHMHREGILSVEGRKITLRK